MPSHVPVPEWHLGEHAFLIDLISEPLSHALPGLPADVLALRARTLFDAVHGVISLSLESRFVGLPVDRLRGEVAALADILARGLPS